ncbi:ABC transporter permease [Magnetococcus sp. PR-3]|uniref:ABC transporter permease n=1 Tax=Magnetococcus sp. PR-3 TaxID=3120355 RepID=UPI002FCE294A
MSWTLYLLLIRRTLQTHPLHFIIALLGVASCMMVAGVILTLDHVSLNQPQAVQHQEQTTRQKLVAHERGRIPLPHIQWIQPTTSKPSTSLDQAQEQREDQAFRILIRAASQVTFLIGSFIIFHTLTGHLSGQLKAFALLRLLGSFRRQIVHILLAQALLLGALGTLLGVLLVAPVTKVLISKGLSTLGHPILWTGQMPWLELTLMAGLCLMITTIGVIPSLWTVWKMPMSQATQAHPATPTWTVEDPKAYLWLLPLLFAASYLLMHPFLTSWVSVALLLLADVTALFIFVVLLIWFVRPLLNGGIAAITSLLRYLHPMEAFLTGRAMIYRRDTLLFSFNALTVVFALTIALHVVTHSMKHRIVQDFYQWSTPYTMLERNPFVPMDPKWVTQQLNKQALHLIPLSNKGLVGGLPFRLVDQQALNAFRLARGKTELPPGVAIISHEMAHQKGWTVGQSIELMTPKGRWKIPIAEINNDLGLLLEPTPLSQLKQRILVTSGTALFKTELGSSLGRYALLHHSRMNTNAQSLRHLLTPIYKSKAHQGYVAYNRAREINRDFVIVDLILAVTIVLVCMGMTHTQLIQLQQRGGEFAIFNSLGMSPNQRRRLLQYEGVTLGILVTLTAMLMGHVAGWMGIEIVQQLTDQPHSYHFSRRDNLILGAFILLSSWLVAYLPARAAHKQSFHGLPQMD